MKQVISCIVLALLCLLLAACGGFEVGGGNPEAAANANETTGSIITVEQNPVAPATATITPLATAEIVATEVVSSESVPTGTVAATSPEASFESDTHAEGTAEILILPGCFDFDSGVSLAPPDPVCDFNVLPGPDSGTIEVYPIETAQLAYGGVFPEAPTLAQCAESQAFSAEPEIVAPMAAMYVCYRTGEGRVGYLHFTDADLEQAGTLTFDWLTFE